MSRDNRHKSRREQAEDGDKETGKLGRGMLNYLRFTLLFTAAGIFFYATGWWEMKNDALDWGMRYLGVAVPLFGLAFLEITENK